jgi:hypothetical protein
VQPRRTWTVCLLGACLLFLVALWLAFDNLTVNISATDLGESGPAGKVDCNIAPWDAGLNHNSHGPGGEHSGPYFDEVAAECFSANKVRFDAALGSGVLALLVLGAGVAVAVRSMRTSAPRTTHGQSG